jgi:PAS domain S-box-containing protein
MSLMPPATEEFSPGAWPGIIDHLDEIVVAAGPDDAVLYVNHAIERLLGWSPADLIGRSLTDLIPERYRARHLAAFKSYVANGSGELVGRAVRLPALRKDGTEVPVELLISTVPALPGVAAIGLLRDVAERVELEGPGDLADRLVATMAEATTLDEAWARVLQALVEALQWDLAQLWLTDGRTGHLERHSAWATEASEFGAFVAASDRVFARGVGLPGRVWDGFGCEWIPDLAGDDNFPRATAALEVGLRSAFAFPLIAGSRLVGVIELFSTARRDPNAPLTARLRELGRELGWFLDRRSSEEQRLALATTLQQTLLPPDLPRIDGLRLAARYLPAGTGAEVGGDFYDVFRVSPSSWGIAIGDVCGKGAEAAALTALARYTLRAGAAQFRSPARALGLLNDAILRQAAEGGSDRFVTTILARCMVDAAGVKLVFACGGHPQPFIRRAHGQVEQIGEPGTLIGAVPAIKVHDTRATLSSGDVFITVTDGVLEARRDDDQFGDVRLADVLRATASATVSETVDAVIDAVLGFQRGHTTDDIAIIAIQAA